MRTIPPPSGSRAPECHVGATAGRAANARRGWSGSGVGTPCSTTSGVTTGSAFAALILLPSPATGPYHAVLASTAKKNARRQRPKASGTRRNDREAANDPDIGAVYHAAAIQIPLDGRNEDLLKEHQFVDPRHHGRLQKTICAPACGKQAIEVTENHRKRSRF